MLKLLWIVLAIAAVIVGGTVVDPISGHYGVKAAAKNACNEHIRRAKGFGHEPWEEEFVRRARIAGVDLKNSQQYVFTVEEDKAEGRWVCHYKVAWRSTTPWFLVELIAPTVQPLTLVQRLDDTHGIAKAY
jgi:hypothetical protein